MPVVSGPDLASVRSSSHPRDEWWGALVQLGIDEIERLVGSGGFEPNEDPDNGLLLQVAAARIEEQLAAGGVLPTLEEGLEVRTFDGP